MRRRAGSTSSSPTTIGRARAAGLPGRRDAAVRRTRSPSSAAPASSPSSPRRSASRSAEHQDLVGLATIADVVPLVDENRAFALAGLRALARTQKPGLRALMDVAHVDPAAVDEGAVGFRLAPRINAAGPARPSAGGARVAADRRRRRGEEARAATRGGEPRAPGGRGPHPPLRGRSRSRSGPRASGARHGYALADADWHEGVIGIVASRLVERYHRPVVLIAGGEERVEGIGPLGRRVRPARRALGVLRPPAALGRPSRRRRASRSIRRRSTSSRARSPSTPTAMLSERGARAGHARRRDRAARPAADARARAGARAARAVRARQSRA